MTISVGSCTGAAAYRGVLYAVGGNVCDDAQCKRYNVTGSVLSLEVSNYANSWSATNTIPSMACPRAGFALANGGGQIFVLGGVTPNGSSTRSVEVLSL